MSERDLKLLTTIQGSYFDGVSVIDYTKPYTPTQATQPPDQIKDLIHQLQFSSGTELGYQSPYKMALQIEWTGMDLGAVAFSSVQRMACHFLISHLPDSALPKVFESLNDAIEDHMERPLYSGPVPRFTSRIPVGRGVKHVRSTVEIMEE